MQLTSRAGHPVTVSYISRGTITIEDDASGMSRDDLARFLEMHGENQARRLGRVVRGRFVPGSRLPSKSQTCSPLETVKGLSSERRRTATRPGASCRRRSPLPRHEVVADEKTDRGRARKILIRGLNFQQLEV